MHGWRLMVGACLVLGVAACSSAPPKRSPDVLPPGTATFQLNSGSETTTNAVVCRSLGGSYTQITIGTASNGVDAYLADGDGLSAKSVTFTDLDGFTGSYWQDVQGDANLKTHDGTYTIDGVARGFVEDAPTASDRTFRLTVVC